MIGKIFIKYLILLLVFIPVLNLAQKTNSKSSFYKGYVHFGYIMQHRNSMGHLVKGHIYGMELDWVLPSYGKNCFEYENNFPERGLGLYWFNLANPEQLGHLIALAPHYEIPLSKRENNLRNYLRLSMGIGYVTKYFDPINNHQNNVVSTPINGFVNVKWLMKYDISKKIRLDYGISLAHASNGKTRVPNLGINVGTLNLAFVFKNVKNTDQEVNFLNCIDSSTFRKSKNEIYINGAFGYTAIYPVGTGNFLSQTYILGYYRNVRNTHKFGGGLDFFYNPANIVSILNDDSVKITDAQNIQIGLKLGWTYNIGNVSLPLEMGCYLKTQYKGDGLFYQRIGLRYYFKNNIFASMTLKSHWARADFFEYGVGYRFPVKKNKS
ncbi:MAG: acyloxyacyl hydrolase [Bacteroidota bacterium]